jgi:hypothetical protein
MFVSHHHVIRCSARIRAGQTLQRGDCRKSERLDHRINKDDKIGARAGSLNRIVCGRIAGIELGCEHGRKMPAGRRTPYSKAIWVEIELNGVLPHPSHRANSIFKLRRICVAGRKTILKDERRNTEVVQPPCGVHAFRFQRVVHIPSAGDHKYPRVRFTPGPFRCRKEPQTRLIGRGRAQGSRSAVWPEQYSLPRFSRRAACLLLGFAGTGTRERTHDRDEKDSFDGASVSHIEFKDSPAAGSPQRFRFWPTAFRDS